MEAIVVLGFLLIPLFGAIQYAGCILLPAYILNISLIRYQKAFKAVQALSFLGLVTLFVYLSQGEAGRSSIFLAIFFATFAACFLFYISACKVLIKKHRDKNNLPE